MPIEFDRFIGIDYSGAKGPGDPLSGIRVFIASKGRPPEEVGQDLYRHWSRKRLAAWLEQELRSSEPTLVGIDHAFSFPRLFFLRHELKTWEQFLVFFSKTMPAHELSIEELRKDHRLLVESSTAMRLCDNWTASAKSVFQFDMQGSVAKSSYAGIPWLLFLRQALGDTLFFWPFDGAQPPQGRSVMCEVYPALYKRRFRKQGLGPDAFDAYSIVSWMQEMQRRGVLTEYFAPPLTDHEWELARMEGWILGVR